MKKIYIISSFLVLCLFVAGFSIGLYQHKTKPKNPQMVLPKNSAQEAGQNDIKTNCDTIWAIQQYDQTTQKTVTKIVPIPAQYIDQTREQVEGLLQEYQKAPVLSDVEQGFLSVSLLQFSESEVRILKTYDSNQKQQGYYLLLIDGKICVYLYDKKTLYFATDLQFDELTEEMQLEILQGKYFSQEKELYSFLESYTS